MIKHRKARRFKQAKTSVISHASHYLFLSSSRSSRECLQAATYINQGDHTLFKNKYDTPLLLIVKPLVLFEPPLRMQLVPSRREHCVMRKGEVLLRKATHCSLSSARNSSMAALACTTSYA
jgi:hypothetical protein